VAYILASISCRQWSAIHGHSLRDANERTGFAVCS